MNFQVKLMDGSIQKLSFSMYFLSAIGKLIDCNGIQETFAKVIGKVENIEEGRVTGGMLDDFDIRAAVIAAGTEAYGFANGDFTKKSLIDGYQVMNQIEDSLKNPIWAQMYIEVCKALIPDKLPTDKKAPAKKKAVSKK